MRDRADEMLALAIEVSEAAQLCGIECALIGGAALAVHHYARATEDLDLGAIAVPYAKLRELKRSLEDAGCKVTLFDPDDDDPLGGVLTVNRGEVGPVQVINFENPWVSRIHPGKRAVANACSLEPGLNLRVVKLEDLIALKLYAGGRKSENDILELLAANANVREESLRASAYAAGLGPEFDHIWSVFEEESS